MKNSLFKKLFLIYGLTIVVGFGILALLLSQLFNSFFIENKRQLLFEQGKKIREEIVLSLYTGRLDQEKLYNDLQVLDKFLNARIWLVDTSGTVFGVSGSTDEKYLGTKIDKRYLAELFQGNTIMEKGTFSGKLQEPSLIVGYPIFWANLFKGGVLIHASLPEVQKTSQGIYHTTIWAILFSILVAYGFLYVQIKKIVDPLKEITKAAKIIAGGEFQKRLQIASSDEIRELAESFNHMASSLEKIEEQRKNLIANLSHDLRSPMTSIRGFVEGILDGTIPPAQHQHYLAIVLEESKRLIKMTNDLLELSNMQQGRVEVNKAVFELNESVRRKLVAFEQQITAKNIQVSFDSYKDTIDVFADPQFVERILTNLLDNAVKFTPPGENISIQITNKKEFVWVEIKNTGTSLTPGQLKNIWERFHKGDASRGEHKGGFGLGLAIVKEMIHRMDEEIRADSGDDYIRFTFSLQKA